MTADRLREVVIAGHTGDVAAIEARADDADPEVRVAVLGALDRARALTDDRVRAAFGDEHPAVRRRAAELAGGRPDIGLLPLLADGDPSVVEVAAWACGEQADHVDAMAGAIVERLSELAVDAAEPLVREASAAALGAIGDPRGLPAILAACGDKPQVRRRAVLALAPFVGDDVEAAIDRALEDRDWQVRQAAEDLRRAAGEHEI